VTVTAAGRADTNCANAPRKLKLLNASTVASTRNTALRRWTAIRPGEVSQRLPQSVQSVPSGTDALTEPGPPSVHCPSVGALSWHSHRGDGDGLGWGEYCGEGSGEGSGDGSGEGCGAPVC
jgi:hypothetical protein